MGVNDHELFRRIIPALKLVCPCSSLLARVHGVTVALDDGDWKASRPTWAVQYDRAIEAEWLGDWSNPYLNRLREFSKSDDREAFLDEHKSERSNLGAPMTKWRVACRRESCAFVLEGDVDDLVRIVLRAVEAVEKRVVLSRDAIASVR